MPNSISYFCRVIHGAEDLVWQDITSRINADLVNKQHRVIEFISAEDPASLVLLRSVDDLFISATRLKNLSHKREALQAIEDQLACTDLKKLQSVVAGVREVPNRPRYTVTASFVGKRNYNRWEIAEAVRSGVSEKHNWIFIDTRDAAGADSDLHLRIHLDDSSGIVGLRLAARPLYKRSYKLSHEPGSLTPQLAYLMTTLIPERNRNTILDPVCGVGTIPIEASFLGCSECLGADIDHQRILGALDNSKRAERHCIFINSDLNRIPLADGTVSAIVSDLPWNRQTKLCASDELNLEHIIQEFLRISRPDFTWVVMTEDDSSLMAVLVNAGCIVSHRYQVSLFGRHPVILQVSNIAI